MVFYMSKVKRLFWLQEVRFLDHCSTINGITEPIECIAYGVIVGEDKKCIFLANWISNGTVDENINSNTILKSAITKTKRLARVYF